MDLYLQFRYYINHHKIILIGERHHDRESSGGRLVHIYQELIGHSFCDGNFRYSHEGLRSNRDSDPEYLGNIFPNLFMIHQNGKINNKYAAEQIRKQSDSPILVIAGRAHFLEDGIQTYLLDLKPLVIQLWPDKDESGITFDNNHKNLPHIQITISGDPFSKNI